ncbi:uncharacterized protein B0H18DRAFT_1015283 [Fomitopsis serialis]|uniref:uncharacterized protein n=1 Tax=Fomitopsis serialis TaxID=139415 RepID=UPI0020088FD9|nr:uncharacterized protein B0H18DRAFT_1015283 [Neoantrodia serialis]KAH9923316.1 hypothetical protein B0H18DRAFT_1015283 [Neoantrodia serialis]
METWSRGRRAPADLVQDPGESLAHLRMHAYARQPFSPARLLARPSSRPPVFSPTRLLSHPSSRPPIFSPTRLLISPHPPHSLTHLAPVGQPTPHELDERLAPQMPAPPEVDLGEPQTEPMRAMQQAERLVRDGALVQPALAEMGERAEGRRERLRGQVHVVQPAGRRPFRSPAPRQGFR